MFKIIALSFGIFLSINSEAARQSTDIPTWESERTYNSATKAIINEHFDALFKSEEDFESECDFREESRRERIEWRRKETEFIEYEYQTQKRDPTYKTEFREVYEFGLQFRTRPIRKTYSQEYAEYITARRKNDRKFFQAQKRITRAGGVKGHFETERKYLKELAGCFYKKNHKKFMNSLTNVLEKIWWGFFDDFRYCFGYYSNGYEHRFYTSVYQILDCMKEFGKRIDEDSPQLQEIFLNMRWSI